MGKAYIFFRDAQHLQSGIIGASISYTKALQFTAGISLVFVAIAFFLESGHRQKHQEIQHQPESDA